MKTTHQIIIAVVLVLIVVGAIIGAWQWGAYQHQECSSDWYWTGFNVGSGKAVE